MSGGSTPNSGQALGTDYMGNSGDNLGIDHWGLPNTGQILGDLVNPPKNPTLQSPDTLSGVPTQAQASTTALQNQLTAEQNSKASYTTTTSGAGLLDEPSTTSRILLGA